MPITTDEASGAVLSIVKQIPLDEQQCRQYKTIRRNGTVVDFEPMKISVAMTKAFLAVHGAAAAQSAAMRETVAQLTVDIVRRLMHHKPEGGAIHIEEIQDQVELVLMRSGEYEVARAYVLYREQRAKQRQMHIEHPVIHVIDNGVSQVLDLLGLRRHIDAACHGLTNTCQAEPIVKEVLKNLYDGVSMDEVYRSAILAARQLIEQEPDYSYVSARLLLTMLRREVFAENLSPQAIPSHYATYFPNFIQKGIAAELLDPRLAEFDLEKIAQAIDYQRDYQFSYLGLQTLFDRYLLHISGQRIELPQAFFMRVAMGLAIHEAQREQRAIEFYEVLSRFDFMSSTPTLFNSGTLRPQLSSCYLTTVADNLEGIYEAIKENALLSKFAGGLGNDWTAVRALGSFIKGTNGQSQGVVPFLKVVNDTAVAVNQGGKRKGAVCAYLEIWHADIEEFLELRKNTGDDRRRTHDMNTANWIPDLFMKRVIEDGEWTLFSPADVPDLHDLYGEAFEQAYTAYEARAAQGEMRIAKRIPAKILWRKMLSMLFETGHPWITFKDPCNIRNPQQHCGVVHSSNLCTEITLNTNAEEIAVCNLGSVNLLNHLHQQEDGHFALDVTKLKQTVNTAMRMLDNVIDINFYPVNKARTANLRHRPVGLGIMGFQDCLHKMGIAYASEEAVTFADHSMEHLAFYAYWASTELAKERGRYPSYAGSLWEQNILPLDSLALLAESRKAYLQVDYSSTLDWTPLRERIQLYGMRNSNCLAIAPTATIANIVGVSASIEPNYQNIFVKSNLSGEFTIVNAFLVKALKARGLWDDVMVADIKYFDGSLRKIDRVPDTIKRLYATAFEIDPKWLIEAAARRQKWIDQAQSLNIYMVGASGKRLDDVYKLAWLRGLKTTYYLRSLAASNAEKSTGHGGELNAVPLVANYSSAGQFCAIDNPGCESCQ